MLGSCFAGGNWPSRRSRLNNTVSIWLNRYDLRCRPHVVLRGDRLGRKVIKDANIKIE
jgi:hypothetical protein